MEILVKHHISGRVRLKSEYFKNRNSLNELKKSLLKQVSNFKSNLKCNSLVLLFDEKKISLNQILNIIENFFKIKNNIINKENNLKQKQNIFIKKEETNKIKKVIELSLLGGFSLFNFIKTYIFEIKKFSDATMSIINLGKYIRFVV